MKNQKNHKNQVNKKKTTTFAHLCAATMLTALAAGCQYDPNDVSFYAIRHSLPPELRGAVDTQDDADRHLAVTNNTNARLLMDDLGRTFYTDRPSRLSPLPVVYTSGNPR